MELAYSYKPKRKEAAVKGMARDVDISFKDALVICDAIRGMQLEKAKAYLTDVISMERPVPYRRFNSSLGHKRNMPERGPGKYPQKAAREILLLLNNITTNAEYKGLTPENLKLTHLQAQKGIARRRRKPKGRWKTWKTQLVHVQAVCEEK
ncbi:MAG: 50S ribosomal protein L22 [Candidatus Altiarchaeota archaeon]